MKGAVFLLSFTLSRSYHSGLQISRLAFLIYLSVSVALLKYYHSLYSMPPVRCPNFRYSLGVFHCLFVPVFRYHQSLLKNINEAKGQ